jgi:hypothetical protein
MFYNTTLIGKELLEYERINASLCRICIVPEYQRNGYDMIAQGDWRSLVIQYGFTSLCIFISALLILHCLNLAIDDHYRRKRSENNNK